MSVFLNRILFKKFGVLGPLPLCLPYWAGPTNKEFFFANTKLFLIDFFKKKFGVFGPLSLCPFYWAEPANKEFILWNWQILSNSKYKSVEHRVIVNSEKERVSLAFFYNPKSDIPIEPLQQLVTPNNPPLYSPMTFDQYRLFIRTQGPRGKSHIESHVSPG